MTVLRGGSAAPARTLVDIFDETVRAFPDAPALDNGAEVLTYAEFAEAADEVAADAQRGSVSARATGSASGSAPGTTDLYVAIMGILLAGAAYVPVDADDPDERARTVFERGRRRRRHRQRPGASPSGRSPTSPRPADPTTDDDAWVIFTSGSTGTPKGVAVSHRSRRGVRRRRSAPVPAGRPLGPGDRVMAGLSVAFDASCEEMWLAWRHGACLVPAPRSLVRSGDGPRAVAGGQRHHRRLHRADPGRALAGGRPGRRPAAHPGRRGLPAGAGGPAGRAQPARSGTPTVPPRRPSSRAAPGSTRAARCGSACRSTAGTSRSSTSTAGRCRPARSGELIIGGVGLARYLDPEADAEKYAPMPALGLGARLPQRRPGPLRRRGSALRRPCRRPGQARRPADRARRDRQRSCWPCPESARRRPRSGAPGRATRSLVGYVAVDRRVRPRRRARRAARPSCRPPSSPPGAWSTPCRPGRRARSTATRCRGRFPARARQPSPTAYLEGTAGPAAASSGSTSSAPPSSRARTTSSTSAAAASPPRSSCPGCAPDFPEVTVADVYERPTVGGSRRHLDHMAAPPAGSTGQSAPVPSRPRSARSCSRSRSAR